MNLLKRLLKKEIRGRVVSKDFAELGFPTGKLTCYKIQQGNTQHMCALSGHQKIPKLGDEIEVEVRKLIPVIMGQEYPNIINKDGSISAVRTTYGYLKINNFRIL